MTPGRCGCGRERNFGIFDGYALVCFCLGLCDGRRWSPVIGTAWLAFRPGGNWLPISACTEAMHVEVLLVAVPEAVRLFIWR